jgi:hypothetical protein
MNEAYVATTKITSDDVTDQLYGYLVKDGPNSNRAHGSGKCGDVHPFRARMLGVWDVISQIEDPLGVAVDSKKTAAWLNKGSFEEWLSDDSRAPKMSSKFEDVIAPVVLELENRSAVRFEYLPECSLRRWARRIALAGAIGIELRNLKSEEQIDNEGGAISEGRQRAFWMSARDNGFTEVGARRLLAEYGIVSVKDASPRIWKAIYKKINSSALAEVYNNGEAVEYGRREYR